MAADLLAEAADDGAETLEGQGWLLDEPPAPPRSPGRPKGARNKSSQQLLAAVQALGADPAMSLVRTYSMDVKALSRKLGCEPLEALKVQVDAMKAVLPYVRSRAPQEHHVKGENVTLVLGALQVDDPDAGLGGAVAGIGPVLDLPPADDMESEQ